VNGVLLRVVVEPDCAGCEQASRIVRKMRERVPDLEVELVVLGSRPPWKVFTPRYLLDGRPVSATELEARWPR
jgi:hypothetical protein